MRFDRIVPMKCGAKLPGVPRVEIPRIDLRDLLCFRSVRAKPLSNTRIPTAQGASGVALGINNKGEDCHAFLYSSSDGSLTDVGSFGGKINAACAINDAG